MSRVMKCIKCTIGLTLILSIDKPGNIKWYINALFVVQKENMSHTGGFMIRGTGSAYV